MAVIADQDQVFPGLRRHHEFLGCGTSDGTAVGIDGNRLQPTALEHLPVGLIHPCIGGLQIGLVGMEGVGVLHDEFTTAHQTEAGPDLIPELGLNLIKVHRQLPVGPQHFPRQGGDHLFMGGTEAEFAALAILQVKHDSLAGCVALPATAAFPEFRGMQLGQQRLQGAGPVHLLPHDGGDALQHLPHQGKVGIDAGTDPANETPTQQQLMGSDLSFRWHIAQRHQHQAGDAHNGTLPMKREAITDPDRCRSRNCPIPRKTAVRHESRLLPSAQSRLS